MKKSAATAETRKSRFFLAYNLFLPYAEMMSKNSFKVALIHDEFVRRGGAEIVFEELLRLFPQAHVYGLYASDRPVISIDGKRYPITTSFLQRLPLWFRRHPKRLLPLLPHAAEQFDFSEYDLVISSSSGFAKGIITRSSIPHICYCHTPTRYLWEGKEGVDIQAPMGGRFLSRALLHYLRMADFAAAQRPDMMIANSQYTQRRIQQYYRRESALVYPPIHTEFFVPTSKQVSGTVKPFLIVGRLTAPKHFEQAIAVCNKLQLPLTIVGIGKETSRLKKLAGRTIHFVGRVTPEELRSHIRSSRALLQPGVEDFGMASVEALACGIPVIAQDAGGVQEIVKSGIHGLLYKTPRAEGLAEGLRQFMMIENRFESSVLQAQAMKFSAHVFRENFMKQVERVLREYKR